ncbi:homogentisate phytyltransferase 1, chloroplastic-like isoform X2 [Andrographis paniculata]|uniref:homogentisate phytyltransferase 1, chloroplastic-like isoform X2 n=1 Tax=Andrographis paniculata TaxID=175694 RepID=UPI0021E898B3|nr:homogentisate phytyltransferase 1, chloroplastic-like isoform X2 [Andrographis paniculata]
MESLLIGSVQKPSSLLSLSFTGYVSKGKVIGNTEKLLSLPVSLQLTGPNLLRLHVQRSNGRTIVSNSKRGSRHISNSTSGHSLESGPSNSPWRSVHHAWDAFYRFSRPHTVIGTALSIISISLLAVEKLSDFTPFFFTGVLEAIVAALFMNIYIVGLNQLTDIEIDKVNKPYLPLASGEYSVNIAVMIISSFAILSFWLGYVVGSSPLCWALSVSFVLGTAYSINLPLLRWKRFAVVAAMCILAVRAVIVQIAFYLHIQMHVFRRPAILTKPVIFATAFMSFFSVVIALFKDIPDIVGDKIYGIKSFTVRLGQEKVFWICICLLEMAYVVALSVGATSSCSWSKWTTVIGHALLGSLLWSRAKFIDFKSKAALTSFYMFIWQLFYAEYLLIPLVR